MKKIKSLIVASMIVFATNAEAQTTYMVDINEGSRSNMDEVLEPGYTPWRFVKDTYESTLTMDDGVVFTVSSEQIMRGSWNKAFVQSKVGNCRLTGDGAALDPNVCGQLTLSITGLAPGQHTIQTYHNSWQDPSRTAAWPITLSIGGQVVHKSVTRTIQQTVASDACVLTTVFSVSSSDESIVMPDNTFLHKSNSLPLCENIKKAPFHRCFLNNKRVCAFFHSCCALFTHYNNI